jgi:hypothetical protein
MCGPAALPVAMLAISFATTAATAVTANQAQNKEAGDLANQNSANQLNINQNLRDQYQQGTQQLVYNNQAAAQKQLDNQRRTRAAEGTALASAGDSGVQGPSVGAVYNEYQGNSSQYASDVEWNKNASDEEIKQQMQGFQSEATSKQNNLPVPNYANDFGTALAIGGDAASGAMTGYRYASPPPGAGPNTSPN